MMMQILLIALRKIMHKHVLDTLIDLFHAFDVVSRMSISLKRLARLEEENIAILCELEMYLPLTFFDIMV
jgi:hypothetical protein